MTSGICPGNSAISGNHHRWPAIRDDLPRQDRALQGLEDVFTVRRLGVSGRLARSLTNTNCIESMISVARQLMGNVTTVGDGSMKKRWVATGTLEAERSFRRLKGCKEMPILVAALRRHVGRVTTPEYDEAVP